MLLYRKVTASFGAKIFNNFLSEIYMSGRTSLINLPQISAWTSLLNITLSEIYDKSPRVKLMILYPKLTANLRAEIFNQFCFIGKLP